MQLIPAVYRVKVRMRDEYVDVFIIRVVPRVSPSSLSREKGLFLCKKGNDCVNGGILIEKSNWLTNSSNVFRLFSGKGTRS